MIYDVDLRRKIVADQIWMLLGGRLSVKQLRHLKYNDSRHDSALSLKTFDETVPP